MQGQALPLPGAPPFKKARPNVNIPGMIDFRKAFDEGDYQAIVDHQGEAKDPESQYVVYAAYLSLGKGKEAMAYFLPLRSAFWEWNPRLCLKANFELRFLLNQFDEAYEDFEYFNNLPYVSQEVEEQLRALPHRIRVTEMSSRPDKPIEEEEGLRILTEESRPEVLLAFLNRLRDADLTPYLEALHGLLTKPVNDDVKNFALILLSVKKDENEITLKKHGKSYRIIPAKTPIPFATTGYKLLRAELMASKEPSLTEIAGDLLDQYAMTIYPEDFDYPLAPKKEALAFFALAGRYLSQPKPFDEGMIAEEADRLAKTLAEGENGD